MMKGIVLNTFGGPENLLLTDLPVPEISDDEVLIKVAAISINPVDIKTRNGKGVAGRLSDSHPLILGWDISGTVTETGSAVQQFKKGDEVFGMINFPGHGKAYAEYVAAKEAHLAIKPENISHDQAAAATLAALTAYQNLTQYFKVQPGQKVLIHSAAGGVGHFAVQIAKHLGAYVIGTSSLYNKDFVVNLGADQHIDYPQPGWEETISGVDFVLDTIGGENIDKSLQTMKPGSTLISIPSGLNSDVAEKAKAKEINGFFSMVQSSGQDMQALATLILQGKIVPHVSKVFKLSDIALAHEQIDSGRTVGKIVVHP